MVSNSDHNGALFLFDLAQLARIESRDPQLLLPEAHTPSLVSSLEDS